jgi:uncharacterized protein
MEDISDQAVPLVAILAEDSGTDTGVIRAELVDEPPRPWGLWATLGFSVVAVVSFLLIQTVVVVAYVLVAAGGQPSRLPRQFVEGLGTNGLLLSLASWITLPFMLGLILLPVKLCRGWSPWDYLALRRVSWKTLLLWLLVVALLAVAFEEIGGRAADSSAGQFMIRVYQTAGFLPLLWATLLVEAPLFEELFFRGFMFRGIQQSRLGGVGAVAVTSLAFTAMHVQ